MVLQDIWVWSRTFFQKDKICLLLKIRAVNKVIKNEKQIVDYHGHKISRIFDVLLFFCFFFYHKWNGLWLLLINMVYTSYLTSCRTTENHLKTSKNFNLVPSLHPKKKILSILAKYSLKIEIDHFPVVCYFTQKLEFVSNIFSVVVVILSILIFSCTYFY